MSETPVRVAVIVGSVREGRFGPVVAHWFAEAATAHSGFEVDLLDLAAADLPLTFAGVGGDVSARLAAAEAFVVVTPEYNHSYPAALKNLIDSHHAEWRAKPVAFVSYGGRSGGLRSVEHLRPVFAELHAVTIRETVSFHGTHTRFDADGTPNDAEVVEAAAKTLLDQLEWWARSLAEARVKRPYLV